MLFQKSLTVRQPRFWAEIAIIVMILLIWSDIGSVVATYLTVCWSHLKGSRQTERHNTMTYHDSFWPVMLVMLVMLVMAMVSMIGPKCFSGFSEHHPIHFCTEGTSHKVFQPSDISGLVHGGHGIESHAPSVNGHGSIRIGWTPG